VQEEPKVAVDVDLSAGSVSSSLGKYKDFLAIPGFMMGATAKYAGISGQQSGYPFNMWGLCDTVASVAGPGVARIINPDYSGGAQASFDIGRIFNNGTYAYIGLVILQEVLGGKWVNILAKFGKPFAAGYAVGSLFDPAPVDAGNMGSGSNPFSGQQLTYGTIQGF